MIWFNDHELKNPIQAIQNMIQRCIWRLSMGRNYIKIWQKININKNSHVIYQNVGLNELIRNTYNMMGFRMIICLKKVKI